MCSFCVIFWVQFENLFSKLVKMLLKSNWIFRRALIVSKSLRFVYFYLTKIYSFRNLKYRARYRGGSFHNLRKPCAKTFPRVLVTLKATLGFVLTWFITCHWSCECDFLTHHRSIILINTMHTVELPNGQLLTGKLWRKDHPLFKHLPFYSSIPRTDDIGASLRGSISPEEWYGSLLVVSNLTYFEC